MPFLDALAREEDQVELLGLRAEEWQLGELPLTLGELSLSLTLTLTCPQKMSSA